MDVMASQGKSSNLKKDATLNFDAGAFWRAGLIIDGDWSTPRTL